MLERMYLSALINRYFTPQITVSDGRAKIFTSLRPDFFHAAQAVYGSVYL